MNDFPQLHSKPRLHGLDYLRGITAFGIMVYHYYSWTFGEQPANSFIGKLGIYGVAIFYVLSGLTLTYMYGSNLNFDTTNLWDFYKKRFFRIFPLLWLATLISILLSKHIPNIIDVVLNITGIFALIKWNTYFATGAWSIGNELTFYITFPFVIYLVNRSKVNALLLCIAAFGSYLFFAFYILQSNNTLANQWRDYTNPINQFVFFLSGVLIAKLIDPFAIKARISLLFFVLGTTIFALMPISGDAIELVTGANRLILTTSCLLLCLGCFRNITPYKLISKPFLLLGQASYSLYLLHPILYAITKASSSLLTKRGLSFNPSAVVVMSVIASLIASYLSYKYFERYFIKISHNSSSL